MTYATMASSVTHRPRRRSVDDMAATSLADDEMAVADLHVDRAVEVGAPDAHAAGAQRLQYRGMGVAEEIVPAAGDERDPRPHAIEQRLRARRPAAVVGDLQHVRPLEARRDLRFRLALDVAGEDDAADLQHHRGVVLRRMPVGALGHA